MSHNPLQNLIEQNPSFPIKPIFSLIWEKKKYWVKHPIRAKQKIWHRLQKLGAKLIPLPIIRPSIALDAEQSLKNEIDKIKAFQKAGFITPNIQIETKNWFCIDDIGITLHEVFEKKTFSKEDSLISLSQKAAKTLAQLHSKKCYHGRAKMNDLILTSKGDIGFIDFEESPHLIMNLESCQARDLYLFISSLARHVDQEILKTALQTYLNYNKTPPLAPLKKLLRLTSPVKLLKVFLARMSKDLRQAYHAQICFEDQI